MDVPTALFEISKVAHREGDFSELVEEQSRYLQMEQNRFPVCVLVTYDMLGELVRAGIEDADVAEEIITQLVMTPMFLFEYTGLPVYFNPRLRTVPVMVVAEPRFWVRPKAKETIEE